jgi:hypothetical protein
VCDDREAMISSATQAPEDPGGPPAPGRSRGRWALAAVLAAVLVAAVVIGVRHRSTVTHGRPQGAATATPVIMVHGYSAAACPGSDVTHKLWGGAYLELAHAGWAPAELLPVSYYRCDTNGVDITGYGPDVPAGAAAAVTAGTPRVGYTTDTPIEQLAHDLAWFVYDTYARSGRPVDLVGVSMGGLIIRDALYRVAVRDPDFPRYLYVPRAVTISTPHAGYLTTATNRSICGGTTECDEFAIDSPFIADLAARAADPQGRGGTAWTVLGSSRGCDLVPATSTLAMPAAERVDYLTPCYTHTSYLWDLGAADDATARVSAPGSATAVLDRSAPRALSWLAAALRR